MRYGAMEVAVGEVPWEARKTDGVQRLGVRPFLRHGHRRRGSVVAELLEHTEAVTAGELRIEEDPPWLELENSPDGLDAIRTLSDESHTGMLDVVKDRFEPAAKVLVVVDYQRRRRRLLAVQ